MRELRIVILSRPWGGLLKLDSAVCIELSSFVQRGASAPEACGVLMGRYLRDEPHVIVDAVSGPCPADRRSRYRAHRSRDHHQRCIDQAWRQSGGTCVYLGEWHSHAEPTPTPSGVDLSDWKRPMLEDKIGGDRCFFVIVGQRHLRLWEGDPAVGRIAECALLTRKER